MTAAVLGLGGNLGDRLATLRSAVAGVAALPGVSGLRVSSAYETPPWGPVAQPPYLNAVALAEVELPALDLLRALQGIEATHGRVREVRWGARTLDLDIVCLGDLVSDTVELTLPHPRAHERAFVLVPWLELDPLAHLPGHGPVASLLVGLDTAGVKLVGALGGPL
jgi:2-amino-4-hydroxy-6-hydroxymethyldihydropteridine diphosphokinase